MTAPFPYILAVTVYDSSNNAKSGITVTAYNETTGDLITCPDTTNASGMCLLDLANMPNGWSEGDYVLVNASGSTSLGEDLRFKCVCKTNFAQINQLDVNYEI